MAQSRCIVVTLCIFMLCTSIQDAQSKKSKWTSAVDVVARLSIVSNKRAQHGNDDYVSLNCPEFRDPLDGFIKPQPNCTVPPKRIVRGRDKVAAFQKQYQLMSGDIIAATLDVRSSSNIGSRRLLAGDLGEATFSLRQGSIRLLEQGAEKEVYTGKPIEVRAVVYLVDFCGWKSPFRSAKDFERYMFDNVPGALEGNLERYYGTCSYGKTIWNPSNVAVVGPIQLDCKGKVPGLAFPLDFDAASKCGAAEQMYWNQAVESFGRQLAANDNKLRAVLQWPERRRIMTILPQEVTCPWYGLAETSCSKSTCFSYIHGKATSNVYTIFHELQHNHGLQHAGWMSAEYGDQTDPMGSSPEGSSGPHCHNAASNWRIGWATPMPGGDLTAASFTPNSNRLRFMIPASGRTDQNMVIVNLGLQSSSPGAASISYPKYFLSYRVRNKTYGGYDAGLSDSFHQKVLVHNYNGTITDRDVTTKTWLIASAGTINTGPRFDAFDPAFGARNIWTGPFVPYNAATGLGGGLRIKVVSVGDTSAEVEVCRMYSQTEGAPGSPDCMANMDRDCDGLIGSVDPDCRLPSPPRRPPSPRRP